MAYVELETDVCKNDFNIFNCDDTHKYKIMYILKERRLGVLKRISAYIPKKSPYIRDVKNIWVENDEYIGGSYVDKEISNEIYDTLYNVKNECYSPLYAKPSFTVSNKYYYKVYSTNNKLYYPKPLIIKKTRANIWEVTSDDRRYMDIVYNYGMKKHYKEPDTIGLYLPNYIFNKISYITDGDCNHKNLYQCYNNYKPGIVSYKNRKPIFNYNIDSYILKFNIRGGITSEKNTCFIHSHESDRTKNSYMECLRLSKDILAVIYKTPFSSLHAFSFAVSRVHSSRNGKYF